MDGLSATDQQGPLPIFYFSDTIDLLFYEPQQPYFCFTWPCCMQNMRIPYPTRKSVGRVSVERSNSRVDRSSSAK
jgi:hypothetical protein